MMMKTMRSKNFCRRKRRLILLSYIYKQADHTSRRAEKSTAKTIQEKGKGFTIFYDLFRDIDVIIEWGVTFDPNSESLDNLDTM